MGSLKLVMKPELTFLQKERVYWNKRWKSNQFLAAAPSSFHSRKEECIEEEKLYVSQCADFLKPYLESVRKAKSEDLAIEKPVGKDKLIFADIPIGSGNVSLSAEMQKLFSGQWEILAADLSRQALCLAKQKHEQLQAPTPLRFWGDKIRSLPINKVLDQWLKIGFAPDMLFLSRLIIHLENSNEIKDIYTKIDLLYKINPCLIVVTVSPFAEDQLGQSAESLPTDTEGVLRKNEHTWYPSVQALQIAGGHATILGQKTFSYYQGTEVYKIIAQGLSYIHKAC